MSAIFVVNVQSRCMNKNLLLKHIVAALGESLEVVERAARASHEALPIAGHA
jgi:hypothetical protein